MIIGRDLLQATKLGCITDFKHKVLTWEDISVVPIAQCPPQFSRAEIHEIIKQTAEPLATQEATKQAVKILDSNYKAADLYKIVRNAEQLDDKQRAKLLVLLKDFEDIFHSTLGKWKTELVSIKLKPDAKPISSRYYPVPQELLRLVLDIGVLTPVQSSVYGTQVFIIPKKEGTVRFLSNYRCLNQTIVCKPYTIPRIGDTMQQLEGGFQYATALDLNMGYYKSS